MKAKANLSRTLVVLAVGLLVAVAVALFGVGPRTAETQTTTPTYYKVQALGTLPGDTAIEPYSSPHGINDFGHVVGEASFSGSSEGMNATAHAFLYKDGEMRDLGTLGGPSSYADDINNAGQVVGYSDTDPHNWYGPQHAFLYENGEMQDLGTLGGPSSYARAINNSGQVVGYSDTASGQRHAFLYEDGEMKDLGTLGGGSSWANGISNSGQVVGSSDGHAFLWADDGDPNTVDMKDLGTLGGGSISWANGINNFGQVVGSGTYNSSGFYHAFLYRGEGPMQDLGVLASGENHLSYAKDINDLDQIVGYSDNDYNSNHYNRAFLYENEEMIDLGTRLHPDNNGNVWNLDSANGINNKGQIVTDGSRKETDGITYRYSALLLTPTSSDTPPPADDTEAPSPPTITSPQNNSYDTDGSFSVSGSAEASSTVELFEGTTSKGTTTADSSGAWSIALSGLSEGTHTYSAKATDAAGNTSSASNSVSVTVDTVAPKVDSVVPQEDPTGVATGVAPGVNVTATFTEGMQDASVKSAFKLYKKGTTTALGASVTYEAAIRTATLDPSANLKRGTTYKAVVSTGAKDLAGNSLDQDESLSGSQQKVWFFTVG